MKDACWSSSNDAVGGTPQPRPWGLICGDPSERPGLIEMVARLWNVGLQSCAETASMPDQLGALVILGAPRNLRSGGAADTQRS